MKSLLTALKMYSRIPCPDVEWREENRRYALCFFPVVGLVTGAFFVGWYVLCAYTAYIAGGASSQGTEIAAALKQSVSAGAGGLLQGAVMMLLPLLVTGGFHMDGYCDVQDALASCAPPEKKLEILKDPHIGSFAVIHAAGYLILQTALYAQVRSLKAAIVIAAGFVFSRALSGLCAVCFKSAKREGSLQDFVVPSDRKVTLTALTVTAVLCGAVMLTAEPLCGAAAIGAAALCTAHYRTVCYREFGGVTGDCAGWFLQNCELAIAAAVTAAGVVTGFCG